MRPLPHCWSSLGGFQAGPKSGRMGGFRVGSGMRGLGMGGSALLHWALVPAMERRAWAK